MSAAAVRERCTIVFTAAERGQTRHFRLVPSRMDDAVRRVADTTRRRYPKLDVPLHSRWRHFSAGGVDRAALVARGAGAIEAARARIDLAVVSVLLDAGAGPHWRYFETATGETFGRSEGLAVASLRAMQAGLFSADPRDPWRADATALARITPVRLAAAFQHRTGNDLVGLEGRAQLLRRLGEICARSRSLFCGDRPAGLFEHLLESGAALSAAELLRIVLRAFIPLWPGRISRGGVMLGDCAPHSAVPGDGLVPFHKLCQWLAYSLVEPLQAAGVEVVELDRLTGLAEYRNGGLFVDCGVVEPCDRHLLRQPLPVDSEPIVEWRALTVILLDRLAEQVRSALGRSTATLPLGKILEGGSWAAGREIAAEKRPGAAAPLTVDSDGTLF